LVPPDHPLELDLETPNPEATWDATQFQEQLETLIQVGPIRPNDVVESYLEYMTYGDEGCPGSTLHFDSSYTLGGCWADSGAYFAGIAWLEVTEQRPDNGIYLDYSFGGDMTIRLPNGDTFKGGGHMDVESTVDTNTYFRSTRFSMAGSWRDDVRTNWMGQGYSGYFWVEASVDADQFQIALDGGVDTGDITVQFSDLSLDDSRESCPSVPEGTIHIRGEEDYWYSWEVGEQCDYCGPVSFQDATIIDEFCYDLSEYMYQVADSVLYPELWPGDEEEIDDAGKR